MKTVRAFGPASCGNVIAGFDTLGAALAPVSGERWGDFVEVAPAGTRSLDCDGPFAHQLPQGADNLVWRAADALARRAGPELPPFRVRLTKGLPVGSGVGSSSASIVALLRALDAALELSLGDDVLLAAAGDAEGGASGARHLDNVAPALLGGLRLVHADGSATALPFFDELRFVIASPALLLETRAARAVLPAAIPLPEAVLHAQRLATLVHSLHCGDRERFRGALLDGIAEPHRAALVPGFAAVQRAARDAGAWGCSFSGAGPAMLALAPAGASAGVGEAMTRAWGEAGVRAEARECVLDRRGARVVEDA
jgi:homoserine kinase